MKIIRITESDLKQIVQKVLSEQGSMFGTAGTEIPGYRKDDTRNTSRKPVANAKENINPKNLKLGDGGESAPTKNADVKVLQQKLMDLKILKTNTMVPTGYFGKLTKDALDLYNSQVGKQTQKVNTTTSVKSTVKPKTTTNGAMDGKLAGSIQQSKDSGFILIFAFPEYQPKIDGDGKLMQFMGSVIRFASGGGKEGTYGKQGHGGCVVIDSSGESTLYEFGRYSGFKKGYGKVLTSSLGRIAKIKNGVLTNPKEVAISARKKTHPPGPNMDMSVAVVKLPNPSGAKKYASVKEREYSIVDFSIGDDDANCGTFARDVASAGGVSMGTFCYPTPKAVVNSFRDKADKMFQV